MNLENQMQIKKRVQMKIIQTFKSESHCPPPSSTTPEVASDSGGASKQEMVLPMES